MVLVRGSGLSFVGEVGGNGMLFGFGSFGILLDVGYTTNNASATTQRVLPLPVPCH